MMKLKHKPQLSVPEVCRAACVEVGIARPVQPDVAAGRAVECAEQMQQGALPRSRRPDDRDELAAPHFDVDAPQDLEHLSIAAREHAPDRLGRQERVHSYRIAVTGSSRAACPLGYSRARGAVQILAATTASAARKSPTGPPTASTARGTGTRACSPAASPPRWPAPGWEAGLRFRSPRHPAPRSPGPPRGA